jgi:hypothetical protein
METPLKCCECKEEVKEVDLLRKLCLKCFQKHKQFIECYYCLKHKSGKELEETAWIGSYVCKSCERLIEEEKKKDGTNKCKRLGCLVPDKLFHASISLCVDCFSMFYNECGGCMKIENQDDLKNGIPGLPLCEKCVIKESV